MADIPAVAQAWRFPTDQSTWKGYQSLQLREVKLSPPRKGEVLVRLYAAALNYSDGAGKVVAVGEGVTQWKEGDRVHSLFFETWLDGPILPEHNFQALGAGTPGCLTQYRVFKAETLLPIPDHLSYEEAATIPCAALTAWNAFFERKPLSDKSTVLVLGSGGVSVFGAQFAKAAGARVIATTSSEAKAQKYRALGVDDVVNCREHPEWSVKVKELTGGVGVEQVLEVGGEGTIFQSIRSIQREGLIHIGFQLSGVQVGNKAMCERLDAFISRHTIRPVIDRVFGWTEVIDAFEYQTGGSHFGKVVVKID
ncbi:unnamed protein product [Rhizoctonia solani]|uniref:Enoyl reductase (ER) domain-containing protein n=1 Tax=Rhizoctonia solani TaxID=456999 RepID=A0A8H2WD11_9AGAM|nr:unnamed protein product [Rhizoctonia solani]